MAELHCLESHSCARIKSLTRCFVFDYSKTKHIPVDQCISSPRFSVGGYDWVVDFYPHGSSDSDQGHDADGSHVSLYLRLLSEAQDVYVKIFFNLLNKTGKLVPFDEPLSHTFTSRPGDCGIWGYPEFISRDKIESCYCKDGILNISCNIRVLSARSEVVSSSGGLYEDIEKLWENGERFDVTFEVEGELISAHRFMLAARSPVFEAELYGPCAEANSGWFKIQEVKADVFKALLQFIYTDDFEHRDLKNLSIEFVQDLFVAADLYDLQMLMAQCQQRMCMALISMETVLPTLIWSERHGYAWLKEECLEFASKSEIFSELVLTEEYVRIMHNFPSLLVEFRHKVKISSDIANKAEEAED